MKRGGKGGQRGAYPRSPLLDAARRAMRAGDWGVAERTWRQILMARREHPEALRGLAAVALTTGRAAMAAELLAFCGGLTPGDAALQRELAEALRRCGRFDAAELALDTAEALAGEAVAENAALHNERGKLLAAQGRQVEAESAFRRAIALDGGCTDAHFHLAGLKRFVAGDPDLAALEALQVRRDTLGDDQRLALDFALGKALDDSGDFPRAFDSFARGNAAVSAQRPYDHAALQALFQRTRSLFDPARIAALQAAGAGSDSPVPVLIVGMPRSGSTLLEHRLTALSQVASAGEGPWLPQSLQAICAGSGGDPLAAFEGIDAVGLEHIGDDYVARLRAVAGAGERLVDKTLLNFLHLGLPLLALPRAIVLHCRRDPLDTGLSIFQQYFNEGLNFAFDLRDIGRFTLPYRDFMALWHERFPGRIVDVDYEELVTDTEGVLRRVLAAMGLDWDPVCLHGAGGGRFTTASKAQVARPVYGSSVGRWRCYEEQLAPLRAIIEC